MVERHPYSLPPCTGDEPQRNGRTTAPAGRVRGWEWALGADTIRWQPGTACLPRPAYVSAAIPCAGKQSHVRPQVLVLGAGPGSDVLQALYLPLQPLSMR